MAENRDKWERRETTKTTTISHDGEQLAFSANDENWFDIVDEFVEESPYPNRSAAIRSLVFLGMFTYAHNNPFENSPSEESEDGFSPVTIRELIPEGHENSVDLKSDLPEIIDNELLRIVQEDPMIHLDGWEVYR